MPRFASIAATTADRDDEDDAIVERPLAVRVEPPAAADAEHHRRQQQDERRPSNAGGLAPVEAQRGGEHVESAKVRDVRMSVGRVHVRAEA